MKPSRKLHDLEFQNSVLRCLGLMLLIVVQSMPEPTDFCDLAEAVIKDLRGLSKRCQQMIEEEKTELASSDRPIIQAWHNIDPAGTA